MKKIIIGMICAVMMANGMAVSAAETTTYENDIEGLMKELAKQDGIDFLQEDYVNNEAMDLQEEQAAEPQVFTISESAPEVETVEFAEEPSSISNEISTASNFTTTGLTAVSAGKERVTLKWNAVSGAAGYLVYGQKNGVYGYVGMTTSGTTFTDTKALANDYNYYWVFPYTQDSKGKMYPGACATYKWAKGICPAVTYLKASSSNSGVTLSWQASYGAAGYLIYGIRPDSSYAYMGMTSNTSYTDKYAQEKDFTYYWVTPYHKDIYGNIIAGLTGSYTYGRSQKFSFTSTLGKLLMVNRDTINLEQELLINNDRTKYGRNSVVRSNELDRYAELRAKELTVRFSTTRPNGTDSSAILTEGKYDWSTSRVNVLRIDREFEGQYSYGICAMALVRMDTDCMLMILNSSTKKLGLGMYTDGNYVYVVQFLTN